MHLVDLINESIDPKCTKWTIKIINLDICIQGLPMCRSDITRRYDFCRYSTSLWTAIVELLQLSVYVKNITHFVSLLIGLVELIGSLFIGNSHQ